ncbi:hypothetical protein LOK49_LG11G00389 [Camellia lanceoleosa]|uniref:Uncharacterized protein n=1 Tax=Camellia lanceoleosa TaxID=1840588 RepID=A0ACC0G3G7_9ERIC|nr:hypothetical protein LOK49_LG11G00389 [Camellia lanceoleosa]
MVVGGNDSGGVSAEEGLGGRSGGLGGWKMVVIGSSDGIRYYSHSNDYLEICRCYKAIYEISSMKEEPAKWIPEAEKHLSEMVVSKALVAKIDWPMELPPNPRGNYGLQSCLESLKMLMALIARCALLCFEDLLTETKMGWSCCSRKRLLCAFICFLHPSVLLKD